MIETKPNKSYSVVRVNDIVAYWVMLQNRTFQNVPRGNLYKTCGHIS